MIFVPKKEDCAIWNETDKGVFIFYCVDGNEEMELPIEFFWGKTPKLNENEETVYEMDYDPFYLSVETCMRENVLECSLLACGAKPQLRYNKIIDKWFCCCPSSAICTKNNDQSEMDELLSTQKFFDYEHGFCNNPIEAILKWNEICANDYVHIAKSCIEKYKELRDKK